MKYVIVLVTLMLSGCLTRSHAEQVRYQGWCQENRAECADFHRRRDNRIIGFSVLGVLGGAPGLIIASIAGPIRHCRKPWNVEDRRCVRHRRTRREEAMLSQMQAQTIVVNSIASSMSHVDTSLSSLNDRARDVLMCDAANIQAKITGYALQGSAPTSITFEGCKRSVSYSRLDVGFPWEMTGRDAVSHEPQ